MNNGNIFKVWGTRRRLLLTKQSEIDLLHLKKNTFCSLHFHNRKINLFTVISGKVLIETEFGNIVLRKNQSFEVIPPLKHRFIALADSVLIEIAFVNKGKIKVNDIEREKLGGKIIEGKYLSIPELRKQGYLEVNNE